MNISKHVKQIDEALSIYINQIVYDLKRNQSDVVTLSLGEAFFDLPPLDMNNIDINQSYHYSDSQGIPLLRKKISMFYNKSYKAELDTDKNILISAGSKIIIFMIINMLINNNDEVIIVEPSWLSYKEQIKISKGKIISIPISEKVSNYKKFFSKKTKIIIICNPNNPAGTIYKKKELSKILTLAKKFNSIVVCDEAYSEFTSKNSFISLANLDKNLTNSIVVNSLSKNFGISGWRIGYAFAKEKYIKKLILMNQHLITCAPTILCQYLAENFEKLSYTCRVQIKKLLKKRKKIVFFLKKNKIKYISSSSTFYIFINIDKFHNSSFDFAMQLLLKEKISVVSGISYGDSTNKYIRISIGTENEEKIKISLKKIKSLINEKKCNYKFLRKKIKDLGIKKFEGKIDTKLF